MTTSGTAWVWLAASYVLLFLLAPWGFKVIVRRVVQNAVRKHTGSFTYHPEHDAWTCPQGQWLRPTSFDPTNRTVRYRAPSAVCNHCPSKPTCTSSDHGREIHREIDPWPQPETGRLPSGLIRFVTMLGLLMPLAILFTNHALADILVLGITMDQTRRCP